MGDEVTLLKEFIPQDLHGREYLKPWLDKPANDKGVLAEVFKKLDNAESLIGKRPLIPGKDATEADWDNFLKTLRPEKAEDYEIPLAEGTKLDDRGLAYHKALREAMLSAGIPKAVAKKFLTEMQQFGFRDQKDFAAKMRIAQDKAKAEYDTAAKAALGDKREEIIARVDALINELAPAAFKPEFAKLNAEQRLTAIGVINAVLEKYVPADKINAKPGASGGAPEQGEEAVLTAEMQKIQGSVEYKDLFGVDHQKMKDRVSEIAKRLAEIKLGKGKK